ncbi:MAG: bifunctional pyr operon transcriptional regulator/uracil phosphoribosyltransferase PyrR [bacterium]
MVREELGSDQMRRTLRRLAHEIIEQAGDLRELALVGIRTRGVTLAERLAGDIEQLGDIRPPVGALDVTLYRDDLDRAGGARVRLQKTDLPFSCAGKDIILVDDVLYTGRTVRAALAALVNFGRPRRVLLAVAVDRGGRELPVRADYVGRNLDVRPDEEVQVLLQESDGRDAIVVQDSPDFKKFRYSPGEVETNT